MLRPQFVLKLKLRTNEIPQLFIRLAPAPFWRDRICVSGTMHTLCLMAKKKVKIPWHRHLPMFLHTAHAGAAALGDLTGGG